MSKGEAFSMTEFQTLENPLSGGVPVGRGGFFGGWDIVEFPTIGNELDQVFTTAVARGEAFLIEDF